MTDTQVWLGLYVFTFSVGGVLIGSLVLKSIRSQVALAIFLAFVTYALLHADENAHQYFGKESWGDLIIFNLIAVFALVAGNGLWQWLKDFKLLLSAALQPSQWTHPPATFSSVDIAKRWFVTVAAATGSLAFSLVIEPEFWDLIVSHLTPHRLVVTALITVGSLVLIGPVEEFIFAGLHPKGGVHDEDQRPAHFERMVQTMSWRALGRIFLVFLLIVSLNVAHSSFEEQLKEGDAQTTLTIVITTVLPAVITYFWCGALQNGVPKLVGTSTAGATAAGMMLFLPAIVMSVMQSELGSVDRSSPPGYPLALVLLALLQAALLSALMFGLPAIIGAAFLSAERRRPGSRPVITISLIVVTLCVVNSVLVVILLGLLSLTTDSPNAFEMGVGDTILPGIASTIGWGVGLLVSGFPDIVRRGAIRQPEGIDPPAA